MSLIYFTITWLAGTIIARVAEPSLLLLGGLGAVGVAFALYSWRTGWGRLWAALLIAAALGAWRYRLSQPLADANQLANFNGQGWVVVKGFVSAEPSVRGTYTQLELTAQEVEQKGVRHAARGKIVFNVARYATYEYGDVLAVAGLLETPPELEEFSYRDYLAARGVHSLMWRPQVTLLGRQPGTGFLRAIQRVKRALRDTVEAILPNPEAGLLNGVLLGIAHTLPDDLYEAFRAAGLTHIIVVSGFNISIVAQAAILVGQRAFHRWLALLASLGAVALYALCVGLSAPVTRASIMGGLFILAQLLGRRSHALTSLALASLVMTIYNPLSIWSVSFQLSFAATLALIVLEPLLARALFDGLKQKSGSDRVPGWAHMLRDILLTTLAAQIATLPLIWYHFGELSVISLLTNALVLPVQPVTMLLGALATGLGVVWLPIGRLAGWLVWPWLRYSIVVVEQLTRFPWASLSVSRPGAEMVVGLYAAMGLSIAWIVSASFRERARALLVRVREARFSTVVLALVAVLVWAAVYALPDGKLHVYFLDVGQGDAILLRTPQGRTVLIDGGADPRLLTSRLGQVLPFWQRHIDLVIATHADQDHLGGLLGLGKRYRIAQAIEPPVMDSSPLTAQWRAMLASGGVQAMRATRGTQVWLGDKLQLDVLHPPAEVAHMVNPDGNQNSLVIRVVAEGCRVLLTADIDAQTEAQLLARNESLAATVLKVAHHGADSASTARFLAAVGPRIAVISVGAENRFGHPSAEVLRQLDAVGCQVLRTDQQGTIELVTDGHTHWIRPNGKVRK